jgi:hypothetical protein
MRHVTAAAPVAFAALCLACAGLVPTNAPAPSTGGGKDQPARKDWTRAEFDKAVIGKKPAEVVKAVGKPDDTARGPLKVDADSPNFDGKFIYNSQTLKVIDPASGKPSLTVTVQFVNGVVAIVHY